MRRLLFVVLLISVIVGFHYFKIDGRVGYLLMLLISLLAELFHIRKIKRILSNTQAELFLFNSYDWIIVLLFPFYIGYNILNEYNFGVLSMVDLALLIIVTGLMMYISFTRKYLISEQGIYDVGESEFISPEFITEIEYSSNSVAVHTEKYRNELGFPLLKLKNRPVGELIEQLEKIMPVEAKEA